MQIAGELKKPLRFYGSGFETMNAQMRKMKKMPEALIGAIDTELIKQS
jgi:hypothetical protein